MFLLLHVKLVKHTPIVVVLHLHDELMIILIKVLKVMSATSIMKKQILYLFSFILFFIKNNLLNNHTWLSRKGCGYLCWSAIFTRYVIASTPHSLIRMCGCWQTSSKWFVNGLHKTSTRGKFTKPVSKSLATANKEGS